MLTMCRGNTKSRTMNDDDIGSVGCCGCCCAVQSGFVVVVVSEAEEESGRTKLAKA